MSDTLREDIITSETADRMLDRVSPIYDNAYIGLWIFESIGREYDKVRKILDELPAQMFPETVTWAIELWERRYGIKSDPSLSIEQRRNLLLQTRAVPSPLNPYRLERYLEALTGRRCVVVENIAPWTFGVYLYDAEGSITVLTSEITSYINKHKQSHMSYELALGAFTTIVVGCQTAYWRYPYVFTGQHRAGEIPDVSTSYGHSDGNVNAVGKADCYRVPFTLAGTVPDQAYTGALDGSVIDAAGEATAHPYAYPMPGDAESVGTRHEFNITGRAEDSPIEATGSATGYAISYSMCGTMDCGA